MHSQLHAQLLHAAQVASTAENAWLPANREATRKCSIAWSGRLWQSGTISSRVSNDLSADSMIICFKTYGGAAVQVDPKGKMWNRLRSSIGQPNFAV